MIKSVTLSFLFLISCIPLCFSQVKFQKNYTISQFMNIGKTIMETADSGFISTGIIIDSLNSTTHFYLMKSDRNGDTLWTKRYTKNGDQGNAAMQTSDGGYIITGANFLFKTDNLGNVLWAKSYNMRLSVISSALDISNDGGFFIGGNDVDFNSRSYHKLVKTDSLGNVLWSSISDSSSAYMLPMGLAKTNDGGCAFMNTALSSATGTHDIQVVRTDLNGNVLWSKSFGTSYQDRGLSIKQTTDGGFVMVGASSVVSNDKFYILKIDSNGNYLWSKIFGGPGSDVFLSIDLTSDNGFVVGGRYGFPTGSVPYSTSIIMKLDSTGSVEWHNTFGGNLACALNACHPTSDNGYIAIGIAQDVSASHNFSYPYYVKTDINGSSNCNEAILSLTSLSIPTVSGPGLAYMADTFSVSNTTVTSSESGMNIQTICSTIGIEESGIEDLIQVFPNPFDEKLILDGTNSKGSIGLCDITGKLLFTQKPTEGRTEILTSFLPSGIYILKYTFGSITVNTRIIK